MSRKIRKVTLLKDIGLPGIIVKAGTEGKLSESIADYWRFYNEKDDFYSYTSDELKKYPDYFLIEYETPKIKSVAMKIKFVHEDGLYNFYRDGFNFPLISFPENSILENPNAFIIEYEEDSE